MQLYWLVTNLSRLPIPLFMRGYGLRSMDWMNPSSPMTLVAHRRVER